MANEIVLDYLTFRAQIAIKSELLLLLRRKALSKLWQTIDLTNNSRSEENYHSSDHMLTVWAIANWLADKNNTMLSMNAQLACLLHDYDHSAGKETDDINIRKACLGADAILEVSDRQRDRIKAIIQKTRFPFLPENEPTDMDEACVRDADLLYAVVEGPDRINILSKLKIEMGLDAVVTTDDLDIQDAFRRSSTMYTEQGKAIMAYFTDPGYKRVLC